MADRFGRKKVMIFTLVIAGPLILLFLLSTGFSTALMAFLAGFFLSSSSAVTLVMGQEIVPRSTGMASGLILGLAFAAGGLGASLTGLIADQIGLQNSLMIIWVLPILAAFCIVPLKKFEQRPVLST